MDNQIIFKCFQTPKGCYLYDRYSNSVIRVSTEQYDELVKIEAGLAEASSSYVIKELQEKGICLPGEVKEIFHPMTPFLTHLLQHRIRDVILQVTQNCNLRCGYCTYGGNYKNRTHSLKTMNFELAKKAIDFGVERSQESSDFVVSFYGGEPLLAFNLIKKCVAYAKENIQGKELHFNMTTNGTLLTTEIMDFLVENRFQLLISLDGDKESHDANRVFKSGKGSFDLIMQNVRNFKARHPSYVAEHVQFNTVINPKTNPSCFDEFFSVSSVFQDTHIMFNEVASSNDIAHQFYCVCKEDIDTFFANKLYARIRSDILFIIEMEYEKHDIEINLQTNTVLFTIAEGIYKHQYNITPNILEEIIADKIILLNCLYGEQ